MHGSGQPSGPPARVLCGAVAHQPGEQRLVPEVQPAVCQAVNLQVAQQARGEGRAAPLLADHCGALPASHGWQVCRCTCRTWLEPSATKEEQELVAEVVAGFQSKLCLCGGNA